jgi:hypothetical protein
MFDVDGQVRRHIVDFDAVLAGVFIGSSFNTKVEQIGWILLFKCDVTANGCPV